MEKVKICILLHNIRSTHNVGSIFRTADGFGIEHIFLSGYTPYPQTPNDTRLPHIYEKMTKDISKTALGAENSVPFTHIKHLSPFLDTHKKHGYKIVGLEQDKDSTNLRSFKVPDKILLVLGEEVGGIPKDVREACDEIVEIPMQGEKESFNVSVATGIALYAMTN